MASLEHGVHGNYYPVTLLLLRLHRHIFWFDFLNSQAGCDCKGRVCEHKLTESLITESDTFEKKSANVLMMSVISFYTNKREMMLGEFQFVILSR